MLPTTGSLSIQHQRPGYKHFDDNSSLVDTFLLIRICQYIEVNPALCLCFISFCVLIALLSHQEIPKYPALLCHSESNFA